MAGTAVEKKEEIRSVARTACVVVGGGPGGAVLALLLARKGVDTTLLEEHGDFDRDFRGDTIHPSVMEVMDEIGLAERLLELPHAKIPNFTFQTGAGAFTPVDFRRLRTKYPYIAMMPQTSFLEFITGEAKKYPNFRLVMSANARSLVEEDGTVRGVRYRGRDGMHEVRAELTVGADGRFSRIRRLAGFEPKKTSPPVDILWFRIPKEGGDPEGAVGRFGRGHVAVMLDRGGEWQCAYVIPKGSYKKLREAGIEALRRSFAELVPEFSGRAERLTDWKDVSLLSIESSRCEVWRKPGLLLIGDAAHVMSPVGGVGINYAIQDAVVAANMLAEPLKTGNVGDRDLAKVQRRRELPTRLIQRVQTLLQNRVLASALRSGDGAFTPPAFLRAMPRVPVLRALPARILGVGVWKVHVK